MGRRTRSSLMSSNVSMLRISELLDDAASRYGLGAYAFGALIWKTARSPFSEILTVYMWPATRSTLLP
jgi:hypothetical protein